MGADTRTRRGCARTAQARRRRAAALTPSNRSGHRIRHSVEARMHARTWLVVIGGAVIGAAAVGQAQKKHLNPMIELHMQKKPIFGLYAPSNPRGRGNRGGAAAGRDRAGHAAACAPGAEDARGAGEGRAGLRQERLRLRRVDGRRRRSRDSGLHRVCHAASPTPRPAGALAPSTLGQDARDRTRSREGGREHQPAAESRRQHDRVRQRRERG